MKSRNLSPLFSLAIVCMITQACGGGSGGNSTASTVPPVAQTCDNGATNHPDCSSIPAKLQTSIVMPPYATGSEDLVVFNYFNDLRTSLGLGKLSYSAELDKASFNHSTYIKLNQVGGFSETIGRPGFTGATLADRVIQAGYTDKITGLGVSGGLAFGNSKLGALKSLLNSVYHRRILFQQMWTEVGSSWMCISVDNVNCNRGVNGEVLPNFLSVTVAHKNNVLQRNGSDFFLTYPMDKDTDAPISMIGETTNPFPQYPDGLVWGKVGYPVEVAVEDSQTISVQTFTITEDGSTSPLAATLMTSQSDPNRLITKNEAFLIANTALKPMTKYTVRFVGAASIPGSKIVRSIDKTISFVTNEYLVPRH